MTLDSLQLATLAAVIHEGTFEAAAIALHVTPSAVSQRIKGLESAVGHVLIQRGKPCRATEAGQPLLRLAGQIALLEREARDAARGPLAGGGWTRAAIVVNADSLATWFLPALAALPTGLMLSFDLREDDQDYTAELLRDGTAMAAVTAQNTPVQGCRVERLGYMRYTAVCAPEVVERWFGEGVTAAALKVAPMVAYNRKDQLQHRFARLLAKRAVDPPVHYVPSFAGFHQAIQLGLGWGLLAKSYAHQDLSTGRLVELAPGRHLDVPLYWQHWRIDSSALGTLTAAVRDAASHALRPAAS